MAKIPHDPNELLAVVDDNDNVIGKASRKDIHAAGKLHRHASVLIINSEGKILLQRRKDNGKLDYSASGHFPYNVGYLEAAVRETEEELGLRIDKHKFVEALRVMDSGTFVCLFEVKGDYKIEEMKIDPLEVASVRYYSIDEIRKLLSSTTETGGFIRIVRLYLEKRLV